VLNDARPMTYVDRNSSLKAPFKDAGRKPVICAQVHQFGGNASPTIVEAWFTLPGREPSTLSGVE
jgi:hypothetical protein